MFTRGGEMLHETGEIRSETCDCSHSTVVYSDDSLPVAFPQRVGEPVIRSRNHLERL